MKKIQNWKAFLKRCGYMFPWILAVCCGLILALSYYRPKLAYEVTRQHVVLEETEETRGITLDAGTVVDYYLDVGDRTICGIQPCFDWGSDDYPQGTVLIEAWHADDRTQPIGTAQIRLDERLREAYAYAAIPGGDELSGALLFTISYLPGEGDTELPQIIYGTETMQNSHTAVNENAVDGDLMMYYASVQKTYPLVFDARMFLFVSVCTGLFMTGKELHRRKRGQEVSVEPAVESIGETVPEPCTGKKKKPKKWLYALIGILTAVLLSTVVELFVYNRQALFGGSYAETVEMTSETAELYFDEIRYIKTLTLSGDFSEDTEFEISVYGVDGTLRQNFTVTADARLPERIVNLREKAGRVVISTQTADNGIIHITASNFTEWNGIRFLFFFSVFGLAAYVIIGRKDFTGHPERAFAVICLVTGGMLILITGTNQISYDEQTHITQAWNLSYIGRVYDTEAILDCKTLRVPVFHNIWERSEIEDYLQSINDYDTAGVFDTSKMISYHQRAYLPIAVFLAIARSFQLPFASMIAFGKFGNLLLYTVISMIAVRVAKKGKGFVAVIALMPNSIFLASQFSYDAFVNCFLLLAMVLVMNELSEQEKKMSAGTMFAMLACFILGSYSKQVYIIMALMLLFLSNRKFPSKTRAWIFRVVLVILCGTMLYEVVSPSYSGVSAVQTVSQAGDKRVEGTGMLAQIQGIIHQPFVYMKLLFSSMFARIYEWFSGENAFHMYAYMGTPGTVYTWLWFAVWGMAALVSPKEENRQGIKTYLKVVTVIMVIGMSAVIWTVLYLSFNVVGAKVIDGVQNRYFAPLFLPVGMCLMNRKLHWKWSEESYYKVLFGASAAILLCCSYLVGIRQWYL